MTKSDDFIATLVSVVKKIRSCADHGYHDQDTRWFEKITDYCIEIEALTAASNYKPEVMVVNEGMREALENITSEYVYDSKVPPTHRVNYLKGQCDIFDKIKAALQASANLPSARDQWLPIESAPRDGTKIIGYRANIVKIIYYDPVGYYYQAGWYTGRYLPTMSAEPENFEPTHWVILPQAPNSEEPYETPF